MLRIIAILANELIISSHIEIGLLHRGTEKLIETNTYNLNIGYFDRLDYVSNIIQELLFIISIETIINSCNSLFISLWRTIISELYRNLNHSLNITTHAIDIGLFTLMLWKFEEREKLINYIEIISGSRLHAIYLLIGKLRYDISLFFIDSFIYWLINYVRKLKEIHYMLTNNRLWRARLYEIGIINKSFVVYFGITGLIARCIKLIIDGRFTGYEFYEHINFSLFFSSVGDSLDRYILRYNEMIESCRIIYLLIYCLFNSLFIVNIGSCGFYSIMEILIEEFMVNFPVITSLIKINKISIESSKGIYSCLLFIFPLLIINIITNDFIVINQINRFIGCINFGDLISIIGSVDFVLGSIDLLL